MASSVFLNIGGTVTPNLSVNGPLVADSLSLDFANQDVVLARDAANVLAQKNVANAQTLRLYGTTTGPKYLSLSHDGTNAVLDTSSASGLFSIAPTNATSVAIGKSTAITGNVSATTGYQLNSAALASTNSVPSDPTGTADTTGKMMGLAGAITPASTKIAVIITGNGANNTINDGWKTQLRYGTGTAPVNGAALTGTAIGTLVTDTADLAGAAKAPFCCCAIITGLTAGTAYWLDLGLAAITGGTASVTDLNILAHDVL